MGTEAYHPAAEWTVIGGPSGSIYQGLVVVLGLVISERVQPSNCYGSGVQFRELPGGRITLLWYWMYAVIMINPVRDESIAPEVFPAHTFYQWNESVDPTDG